ncbi:MAG TPA: type VII secretion-associated serine protease mycosin, partial [Micromonospora sp.]
MALTCATAVAFLPPSPAQADEARDHQWHLRYLRIAEAHKVSQGEGVTVAVIDTGVDPHPDLRNNLLTGTDVVSGGKGNGHGDSDSHGTAMAGLIAAHGNGSGDGVLGIAPKAKILPIRDETKTSTGNADNIARGIEYAITKGAKVVSISSSSGPSSKLRHAIEKAIVANIVVVAGSGNKPHSFGVTFPAFLDGVVAVGATDKSGNHADISITGKKVEISAPGVDIYSTSLNGKYKTATGTSNATAIVAGAAALVRSRYPELSAKEVVHRLTATAVDKGAPGRDVEYGYGVLDVVAALTADVPPLAGSPSAGAPSASPTTVLATPLAGKPSPGERTATRLIVFGLLGVLVLGGGA